MEKTDKLDWKLSSRIHAPDEIITEGSEGRKLLDLFRRKEKFEDWAYSLREEVISLMSINGLKNKINNPRNFVKYLDKVVVKRARKLGFEVNKKKAFILTSLDEKIFFKTLEKKCLFYESSFVSFVSRGGDEVSCWRS